MVLPLCHDPGCLLYLEWCPSRRAPCLLLGCSRCWDVGFVMSFLLKFPSPPPASASAPLLPPEVRTFVLSTGMWGQVCPVALSLLLCAPCSCLAVQSSDPRARHINHPSCYYLYSNYCRSTNFKNALATSKQTFSAWTAIYLCSFRRQFQFM